jgi:hypothetical protein
MSEKQKLIEELIRLEERNAKDTFGDYIKLSDSNIMLTRRYLSKQSICYIKSKIEDIEIIIFKREEELLVSL